MTIFMNSQSSAVDRLRTRVASHPAIVPPATMWEPRDIHPSAVVRSGYGATMRTLKFEHEGEAYSNAGDWGDHRRAGENLSNEPARITRPRATRVGACTGIERSEQPVTADELSGSNIGSYIVGAVFGLVVFAGTVLGGMQSDDIVYDAPAVGADSAVVAVAAPSY